MTARLPKQLRRQSAVHAAFEAEMNSGKPIVDNASDRLYAIGELEYDGPRCDYCGDTQTVEDGDRLCPACLRGGAA